jgi:hypothetical protein
VGEYIDFEEGSNFQAAGHIKLSMGVLENMGR